MATNEDLIHALRAATMRWHAAIVEFGAQHDLGETDVRALIALLDLERAHEAATPGVLGAQLCLSSAATTALVDRLVAAGMVARARDRSDRRRVNLTVTPHAVRYGEDFFIGILAPLRAAAAQLTCTETDAVRRFLAAVGSP